MNNVKKIKLCYLVSHPIQYQAPMLRLLAKCPEIDLCVYFFESCSHNGYQDKGFNRVVKWDTALFDGYRHEFLSKRRYYKIYKKLKKNKYDILWAHGYANFFLLYALIISKFLSIKTFVRGDTAFKVSGCSKIKSRIKSLIFKKFLNRIVDGFLSIGSLNKEFYLKQKVIPEKIYFAPYTVDNTYFESLAKKAYSRLSQLKQELGLDENRPIILYVGKFDQCKCPDQLLYAYHHILPKLQNNKAPYLLFIGSGELEEKLKTYVRINELCPHVRFLGFKNQSELPAFYQLCDIFVLPSERENWGLVINEVMNAGKAVVVSDAVGCAPDLVMSGNGFIFPAGNIEALSKVLFQLVVDQKLRDYQGEKSLERINNWGLPETVNGVISACINVLS